MLEIIHPIRFHASVTSGRTKPCRLVCEKDDGSLVEVVAKFSAGCDRGVAGLAMEVVAARLGIDLALPVPAPYLLLMEPHFIRAIPGHAADRRQMIEASNVIAFGSTEVGTGFRPWTTGDRITEETLGIAAAIFAFDGFIANPDRRVANPNCLVKGHQLRIIDHEAAFLYRGIVGWTNPWQTGGLSSMAAPGNHMLFGALRGRNVDFAHVEKTWGNLTEGNIQGYRDAMPPQWANADQAVEDAISLIQGACDNLVAAFAEVRRVLA